MASVGALGGSSAHASIHNNAAAAKLRKAKTLITKAHNAGRGGATAPASSAETAAAAFSSPTLQTLATKSASGAKHSTRRRAAALLRRVWDNKGGDSRANADASDLKLSLARDAKHLSSVLSSSTVKLGKSDAHTPAETAAVSTGGECVCLCVCDGAGVFAACHIVGQV